MFTIKTEMNSECLDSMESEQQYSTERFNNKCIDLQGRQSLTGLKNDLDGCSVIKSEPTENNSTHNEQKPFYCDMCGDIFMDEPELLKHLEIHSTGGQYENLIGSLPHKCTTCEISFMEKSELTQHTKMHSRKKSVKCEVCHKCFSNASYIKIHMRSHSGYKPFECCVCNKGFVTKSRLTNHLKIHTGRKSVQCSICEEEFSSEIKLSKHIQDHKKRELFTCSFCGKVLSDKSALDCHLSSHTERNLQCNICEKILPSEKTLAEHIECHIGEKTFICSPIPSHKSLIDNSIDTCWVKKETGENVDEHTEICSEQMQFECCLCRKGYIDQQSLDVHMITHTRTTSVSLIQCNICNEMLSDNEYIKEHMLLHACTKPLSSNHFDKQLNSSDLSPHDYGSHSSQTEFCCDICGKGFIQKSGLDSHMMTHSGKCEILKPLVNSSDRHLPWQKKIAEKKILCDICNKVYKSKKALIFHYKTHFTQRKFECNVCGKIFKQRTNLSGHIKTHIGEKKFQCSFCGKRFLQKGNLKVHMKTHTGDRAFQCGVCKKSFIQKTQRNKHLKIHLDPLPNVKVKTGQCYT